MKILSTFSLGKGKSSVVGGDKSIRDWQENCVFSLSHIKTCCLGETVPGNHGSRMRSINSVLNVDEKEKYRMSRVFDYTV